MDLKNFESTSTYAIQACYLEYWHSIPEKYRLLEKAQRNDHGTYSVEDYEDSHVTKKQRVTPLTYKETEETEYEDADYYDHYCNMLNSGQWFDLLPFYDPQLDFDNRLHYKLAGIDYPDRQKPWFIITWNFGNGILKSSLTRRRFQTCADYTPSGEKVKFDFMNTEMDLTFAIYSNSMQGLFELQENILISKREKCTVTTATHSILGNFPVSLDTIDSSLSKLPRDKGTLCVLTLNLKIDYPIIGNVQSAEGGIIKEFHLELDSKIYTGDEKSMKMKDETEIVPNTHEVLSRDVVTEDTPDTRIERDF